MYYMNCPACKNWCEWSGSLHAGNWYCPECGWISESQKHPLHDVDYIMQDTIDLEVKAKKIEEVQGIYLGGVMHLGVKVKFEQASVSDIIEALVEHFGVQAVMKAILE